jgi:TrmH family RNA methyltransferase
MLRERMRRITSRQHPLVARFREAARGGADAFLLLDGPHLVAEALDAAIRVREAAVADGTESAEGGARHAELRSLIARLGGAGVDVVGVAPTVMKAISPVRSPSAIVALADRPSANGADVYGGTAPLVIVAVGVQDPGNVGAIVRVAEAGGATGVVGADGSADPYGWKALRGSMGSAFRVPIGIQEDVGQTMADARRRGCRIVAAVPRGGRPLGEVDWTKSAAVLVGGEGTGLSTALVNSADDRVTIPMEPPVESLNAAVAAALIVYEARRQRGRR